MDILNFLGNGESKYYDLRPILKLNAAYNMIIGERSNGKSYSLKDYCLKDYFETGRECSIVRRNEVDFKGNGGATYWEDVVNDGLVAKYSKGEWEGITYKSKKWYFHKYSEITGRKELSNEPFAYGFCLSTMEHDKSQSYPRVFNVVFEEFMTRDIYLVDEFVIFSNVLSTIIRHKKDVKIFMLANTVNKFCPYFKEMGLKHVQKMKKGTIDLYTYGDTDLKVAVERCLNNNGKGKESDKYFAFDNPKLKMITSGEWEIAVYPHLPVKYKPKDVLDTFYIEFDENILQGEIIQVDCEIFTYIHKKTTPIKDDGYHLIFHQEYDHRYNHRRNILKPTDDLSRYIYSQIYSDNVYYQDNDIGEVMRNYLLWCQEDSIIK